MELVHIQRRQRGLRRRVHWHVPPALHQLQITERRAPSDSNVCLQNIQHFCRRRLCILSRHAAKAPADDLA